MMHAIKPVASDLSWTKPEVAMQVKAWPFDIDGYGWPPFHSATTDWEPTMPEGLRMSHRVILLLPTPTKVEPDSS